jgi:hypothetical protein
MIVDDDALSNLQPRILQPFDIGPNACRNHVHIGGFDFAVAEPNDFAPINIVDARDSGASDDLDTSGAQPTLDDLGSLGRVTRVRLQWRDADHRLRRLERACLHLRTRQLTPQATSAPLGCDLQHLGHVFRLLRFAAST